MSDYGEAIDEAREELADAAGDFMPDTCTLTIPGSSTTDDYGNTTTGSPTTLSGVPCGCEPLSVYEQSIAGTLQGGATDALKLPHYFQGNILLVDETYTVMIDARGNNPARTLQVVGPLKSSTELLQRVAVTEG